MANYSVDELYAKLDRADTAGDAEAARVIAEEIRRVESASAPPTKTTPSAAKPPSPAQLAAQAERRRMTPEQRDAAAARSAQNYQIAIERNRQGDWGGLKNYLDAVQHRVLDPVHGAAQLLSHGVQAVTDRLPEGNALRAYVAGTVAADDAALRQRERDYQQRTQGSIGADVGGVVGSVLPYLAPSRALQGIGRKVAGTVLPRSAATGITGRAVSGATQGAITGALQPVTEDDFVRAKAEQTALGAAFGGAVPVAAGALAPVLGKAISTARGVVDPAARKLQDLGERFGVRLSYGDITQKALPKKTEVALESIPVLGTGGFRAAQQAETKAAAEGVSERLHSQLKQTPFQHLAEVDQAAARGNKAAIELKQELANAGDDWNRIVQASGNLQAFRTRQQADRLYGEVERLAAGSGSIGVAQTVQAVRRAWKEASAAKLPDKPTIKLLSELQESLVPSGGQAASNTYSAMRQLRSDLGDLIADYYKGSNALTGSKGVGILQQVRSAVESDMDAFASRSNNPALTNAWRKADRFYRERVVPFKDRQLANAMKDAHADEIYTKFVQAGKGARAEHFYGALDARGQAAVRYGMVANAMEKSVDETRNVFSPAKFAQAMERVKDARGVFFRGAAKKEVEGFTKLMRHVERAGQYAENPPTGQRTIPWLLGGAAAINAPLAAKVAAVSGIARAMLTTGAGKRFLLASAKLEDGSPAMAKLLQRIEQTMPKLAGATAGATDQTPLEVEVAGGTVGAAPSEEELQRLRAATK